MSFLMKNLVRFFELDPPTAAIEIYKEEKVNITNKLNMDIQYQSPEIININRTNVKMQALSIAFGKQRQCRVDRKKNSGNIFFYLCKLINYKFRSSMQCQTITSTSCFLVLKDIILLFIIELSCVMFFLL